MKPPLVKFYHDPAIGFPRLRWAIRFMRSVARGFGVIKSDGLGWGVTVALWWSRRIELVRLPRWPNAADVGRADDACPAPAKPTSNH